MTLVQPLMVALDTSHWANWIDAALSSDIKKREAAQRFHERLLGGGRVPFLSWHHLEELLAVDIAANARARLTYLQSLPLIAWMRLPGEIGLGSITDILAAEAIAFAAGCSELSGVRDHVRSQLLQVGEAKNAVGHEKWVWEAVRPLMMERRLGLDLISALSGMKMIDEQQTIGQLAQQQRRSPAERRSVLARIHASAMRQIMEAEPGRSAEEAKYMADDFISRVLGWMPEENVQTRDSIVATYARQGLDPDEVRDECTVAELSTLATFRSRLRVVAEKSGLPFERLKRVRMHSLPSWRIGEALRRFGQQRARKPGSDIHDQYLAVLAAYTDLLYVDKRTHEDLRRVTQKDPELARLFGTVAKASSYSHAIG